MFSICFFLFMRVFMKSICSFLFADLDSKGQRELESGLNMETAGVLAWL